MKSKLTEAQRECDHLPRAQAFEALIAAMEPSARCTKCGRWFPGVHGNGSGQCPACTCGCDQCEIEVSEYDAAETERILDELT
jgi:hypothetical protein